MRPFISLHPLCRPAGAWLLALAALWPVQSFAQSSNQASIQASIQSSNQSSDHSQAVSIQVDASRSAGSLPPVWAWIGYDEPNNTYSDAGIYTLKQLAQSGTHTVHARTHNLLTTGDGTTALKWGSTNAFTRDANGKPVYDWSIVDRIFDTYRATGIKPLVEIGFMPQALSTSPIPYQHHWPQTFATGWSYPPVNYDEWSELVYRWVQHMVQRYGAREVSTWQWEVWNEPDIFYWHGTAQEYFKLYDYTVTAVRRALPRAHVGGPASTSPSGEHAAAFLNAFLDHCLHGINAATGKKSVPLDFVSFHAKGRAALIDNHVQLSIATQLRDIDAGFAIVESFRALRDLPVLITESDPESCAACDVASHPENGYRLTSQYASYEAEVLNGSLALAQRHHINLQGNLTWAFTFPGQPLFAGLRAFSTHDIDLPLMNAFRMFGKLNDKRIEAVSSGALNMDDMLSAGVRDRADVNVIATRSAHQINILIWNYRDDAVPAVPQAIQLAVKGLPSGLHNVQLRQWRIDDTHSNALAAWLAMNSPPDPSATQMQQLHDAGQLQLLDAPQWISAENDMIDLNIDEPSQAVALLELSW